MSLRHPVPRYALRSTLLESEFYYICTTGYNHECFLFIDYHDVVKVFQNICVCMCACLHACMRGYTFLCARVWI